MANLQQDSEWVRLTGFAVSYEINRAGVIRHQCLITSKWIYNKLHHTGRYPNYSLRAVEGCRMFLAHRLVAQAFIPNPENKKQVNHKNGDRTDFSVANLEWVTASENMHHAYAFGLLAASRGSAHYKSKLNECQVVDIISRLKEGESYPSIAKRFPNCNRQMVKRINLGYTWKHIPR